jgi:hypothetical protein
VQFLDMIRSISAEKLRGYQLHLSHLSLASTPPPPNKKMLWLGAPFGRLRVAGRFFLL